MAHARFKPEFFLDYANRKQTYSLSFMTRESYTWLIFVTLDTYTSDGKEERTADVTISRNQSF